MYIRIGQPFVVEACHAVSIAAERPVVWRITGAPGTPHGVIIGSHTAVPLSGQFVDCLLSSFTANTNTLYGTPLVRP